MTLTLQEMVTAVATGLSDSVRKPNIHGYIPNPGGQIEFHKCPSFGRLLAGDNRSGKSVGGIVEDCWWLTGRHPYLETPEPPVQGRIITVDFEYGCDQIILPLLSQWLPPSELKNGSWEDSYSKKKRLLTLRNGSTLEIKAHGQDIESFAGVPRHFLHVDEECPKTIFIESKLRLLDYNGKFWITLTPIEGQTWVYDELVEGDPVNVKVFSINVEDNPHIDPEAIKIMKSDLDEEETAIRLGAKKGTTFMPRGGLVFEHFNYDKHVIKPGLPPTDWTIVTSVDHGFNNPTAWLWHAVHPDGDYIVTFMEHYKRLMTVEQHAARVKEIEKEIGRQPWLRVGDPSMQQRSATTGHSILVEYTMNGIVIKPGHQQRDNTEIDRMNNYLRLNRWFITENCPNLIREIRKAPWKRYQSAKIADLNNRREEPLKKDDHAWQSTGYWFRFMPDLKGPVATDPPQLMSLTKTQPEKYPWRVDHRFVSAGRGNPDMGFGEVP